MSRIENGIRRSAPALMLILGVVACAAGAPAAGSAVTSVYAWALARHVCGRPNLATRFLLVVAMGLIAVARAVCHVFIGGIVAAGVLGALED